jgi:putative phosphoribosyl transferase
MLFANRVTAGRRLAERLARFRSEPTVVLGLPRGGVPVAAEVAEVLGAPLDVIVVRKLGVPHQPELAMGAIGEDGVRVVNDAVVRQIGIADAEFAAVERRERAEVDDRARRFRGDNPRIPLEDQTVLIVDDGIATGSTMRAACQVARAHGAGRVVVAVPVAPPEAADTLARDADDVICLATPEPFYGVGQWYDDFGQTSDAEVVDIIDRERKAHPDRSPSGASDQDVTVPAGSVGLDGHLTVPDDARGVVVFVHGSGSSRHSPRNQYVARVLNASGIGTLLFDLLTSGEELDRANVFDIDLLASRLVDVTRWLADEPAAAGLRTGYFGASTGAAAALVAAASPDSDVDAVVSRGGRPDLAGDRLGLVRAPTLLIVGGDDDAVLDLNRSAQRRLRCENRLSVVPGATHLFEEPGTLEAAADLARDWFLAHFR